MPSMSNWPGTTESATIWPLGPGVPVAVEARGEIVGGDDQHSFAVVGADRRGPAAGRRDEEEAAGAHREFVVLEQRVERAAVRGADYAGGLHRGQRRDAHVARQGE